MMLFWYVVAAEKYFFLKTLFKEYINISYKKYLYEFLKNITMFCNVYLIRIVTFLNVTQLKE